jgi:hypothetical protein
MPEPENPQDQIETAATVYATPKTAAYLQSIGVDPAQNPALNGKQILFAQQGDVTPGTAGRPAKDQQGPDHAYNYATAAVTDSPRGPNLAQGASNYMDQERQFAQAVPELKNEGNGRTGSDTPNLNMLAENNNNALNGNEPSAGHVGTNGCVVALPAPNQTAQEAFAKIAGVAPEDVQDVPGTNADWAKMLANHELGHCADSNLDKPAVTATDSLKREAFGDNASLAQWAKDGGDPAVAQAFRDARALDGFGDPGANDSASVGRAAAASGGDAIQFAVGLGREGVDNVGDHATHPLLDDDKGNPSTADPQKNPEQAGMIKVNTMVAKAVGVASVVNGNTEVLDQIHGDMKLFAKDGDGQPQNQNRTQDEMALADAGSKAGMENEAVNYAALNALKDRGAFKEGTPEAAYADQIIGLQNKYMPGLKDTPEYQKTYDAVKNLPDDGIKLARPSQDNEQKAAPQVADEQEPAAPPMEDNGVSAVSPENEPSPAPDAEAGPETESQPDSPPPDRDADPDDQTGVTDAFNASAQGGQQPEQTQEQTQDQQAGSPAADNQEPASSPKDAVPTVSPEKAAPDNEQTAPAPAGADSGAASVTADEPQSQSSAPGNDQTLAADGGNQQNAAPDNEPAPAAETGAAPQEDHPEDNTSRPSPSYSAGMSSGSLTGDDWQNKASQSAPDLQTAFRNAVNNTPAQDDTPAYTPPAPAFNNRTAPSVNSFG